MSGFGSPSQTISGGSGRVDRCVSRLGRMDTPRWRRALLGAVVAAGLLAAVAVGCTGTVDERPTIAATGATVETENGLATPYGVDAGRVWVLEPRDVEPRSIVVFLHGWGATLPFDWQQVWFDHLLADGNIVIFPQYQGRLAEGWGPVTALDMRDGLRAGFEAIGEQRDIPVVAAGFSVGAALVFIYAANADLWGLPGPEGVYSMFPVHPRTIDPTFDGRPLPRMEVVLFIGEDDDVVGRVGADVFWSWIEEAKDIPASSKTYRMIRTTDDLFAMHDVPSDVSNPAVRDVFWPPLDRMINAARAERR